MDRIFIKRSFLFLLELEYKNENKNIINEGTMLINKFPNALPMVPPISLAK